MQTIAATAAKVSSPEGCRCKSMLGCPERAQHQPCCSAQLPIMRFIHDAHVQPHTASPRACITAVQELPAPAELQYCPHSQQQCRGLVAAKPRTTRIAVLSHCDSSQRMTHGAVTPTAAAAQPGSLDSTQLSSDAAPQARAACGQDSAALQAYSSTAPTTAHHSTTGMLRHTGPSLCTPGHNLTSSSCKPPAKLQPEATKPSTGTHAAPLQPHRRQPLQALAPRSA